LHCDYEKLVCVFFGKFKENSFFCQRVNEKSTKYPQGSADRGKINKKRLTILWSQGGGGVSAVERLAAVWAPTRFAGVVMAAAGAGGPVWSEKAPKPTRFLLRFGSGGLFFWLVGISAEYPGDGRVNAAGTGSYEVSCPRHAFSPPLGLRFKPGFEVRKNGFGRRAEFGFRWQLTAFLHAAKAVFLGNGAPQLFAAFLVFGQNFSRLAKEIGDEPHAAEFPFHLAQRHFLIPPLPPTLGLQFRISIFKFFVKVKIKIKKGRRLATTACPRSQCLPRLTKIHSS
jgi:hypothetical protein